MKVRFLWACLVLGPLLGFLGARFYYGNAMRFYAQSSINAWGVVYRKDYCGRVGPGTAPEAIPEDFNADKARMLACHMNNDGSQTCEIAP